MEFVNEVRKLFFFHASVNVIAFASILIVAASYTLLNGTPTISDFMAENIRISISVAAFILYFILCRTYMVARYTGPSHVFESEPANVWIREKLYWYSVFMMIFFVFQVTFLTMIPLVPVTKYSYEHYIFAGLGILFSVLNETVLFARRVYVHRLYDRAIQIYCDAEGKIFHKERFQLHFGYSRYMPLLGLNLLLVLGTWICAIVFGCYTSFSPSQDASVFTTMAFSEYVLFWFICVLPAFHFMDVYRPLERKYLKHTN